MARVGKGVVRSHNELEFPFCDIGGKLSDFGEAHRSTERDLRMLTVSREG
jgi:hypothetical protein